MKYAVSYAWKWPWKKKYYSTVVPINDSLWNIMSQRVVTTNSRSKAFVVEEWQSVVVFNGVPKCLNGQWQPLKRFVNFAKVLQQMNSTKIIIYNAGIQTTCE